MVVKSTRRSTVENGVHVPAGAVDRESQYVPAGPILKHINMRGYNSSVNWYNPVDASLSKVGVNIQFDSLNMINRYTHEAKFPHHETRAVMAVKDMITIMPCAFYQLFAAPKTASSRSSTLCKKSTLSKYPLTADSPPIRPEARHSLETTRVLSSP